MDDSPPNTSKYYDLSAVPSGWTPDEFRHAVVTLETLPRGTLVELLRIGEIVFTEGYANLDDEELISVILSDFNKQELLDILRSLQQQKAPTDSP